MAGMTCIFAGFFACLVAVCLIILQCPVEHPLGIASMKTKAKEKPNVKSANANRRIRGLHGMGLIRSGDESRLELRDRLKMPRVVFGRVVNVSERTIAKVESAAQQVEKLRRPYNEVFRLYECFPKWWSKIPWVLGSSLRMKHSAD